MRQVRKCMAAWMDGWMAFTGNQRTQDAVQIEYILYVGV